MTGPMQPNEPTPTEPAPEMTDDVEAAPDAEPTGTPVEETDEDRSIRERVRDRLT